MRRTPTSGHYEYYTPQPILDRVLQLYGGGIDCDPASNPPPYHVPATVHFTAADSGLWRPWPGRVWCNPPYGRLIPKFLTCLQWNQRHGHTTEACFLLPDETSSRWWQDQVWTADALCFIRGRLTFYTPGKLDNEPPVKGNILCYWGPQWMAFAATFADLGRVMFPAQTVC